MCYENLLVRMEDDKCLCLLPVQPGWANYKCYSVTGYGHIRLAATVDIAHKSYMRGVHLNRILM